MKIRSLLLLPFASAGFLLGQTPVLQEDFNDNARRWLVQETPQGSTKVQEGRFVYENLSPDKGALKWLFITVPHDKWRDLEISTRVKVLESPSQPGDGGLLWDHNDKHWMAFELSVTGCYTIYESDADDWFARRTNVPSDAIKKDGENELTVRLVENRAYFLINGQLVDACDVHPRDSDHFGLFTDSGATVSFDNLTIRYLDNISETREKLAPAWDKELAPRLREIGPKPEEFTETFDDNKREWPYMKTEDLWSASIANGVLRWENKRPSGGQGDSIDVPINGEADYELNAKVRQIGATDEMIGVSWNRTPGENQGLMFAISGSMYSCYYFGGRVAGDVPWTESSAVKKGQVNQLTVKKLKHSLFFFINGQLVTDLPVFGPLGSKLGVFVAAKMTGEFDDIRVTYPPRTEAETQAEYDKDVAYLKANHAKPNLGVTYSGTRRAEQISRDNAQQREALGLDRGMLTDADQKALEKTRKQWDGKKLLSLYGSWGRPVFIGDRTLRVYYNYKLIGRTQYWYEFQIFQYQREQKDWVIDEVQLTDRRW